MPTNLAVDEGLVARLRAAASRGVSPAERRLQRLSFVYGNLPKGNTMTKDEVEHTLENLDSLEGRA